MLPETTSRIAPVGRVLRPAVLYELLDRRSHARHPGWPQAQLRHVVPNQRDRHACGSRSTTLKWHTHKQVVPCLRSNAVWGSASGQ